MASARSPAIGGAPRWVSGLLAGAQGALLSFLVVATPAVAAYVATSADPSNAEIGWTRSVTVGAVLWLMAHGAAVEAGGALVTIVPLGLTALALFCAYASARRSAHPTRSAWLAGIGGYAVVVIVVVLLAGPSGPLGAGPGALVRTALGTLVVAALGLGAGVLPRGAWSVRLPLAGRSLPASWRAAVGGGVMATALLVAAASFVVGAWAVAGRAGEGDVIAGLGLDIFSGALLAVAQLTVAPNFVLWGLAWIAGPGFAVGEGTRYAPTEVVSGPLPALPMLGALPTDGGPGMRWVPLLVVAAGAVAGWWLHRRTTPTTVWQPFLVAGGTALTAGLASAGLTLLAAGSAGPGRLAVVGGAWAVVGLHVAVLTLAGALVVAVPADPVVRASVRRRAHQLWRFSRPSAR